MTESCECCSYKCVRWGLIAYNIIFWFSGPATLGLGIWFLLKLGTYSPVVDTSAFALPAYFLMAVGTFIILVGIFGCLGAVNESKCLIGMFFLSLLIIFAFEIFACVESFLIYDEVSSLIINNLNYTVKYAFMYSDTATVTLNTIQQDLACCGSSGYNDWQYSRYYNDVTYAIERGPDVVPLSCCYETNNQQCNDGANNVAQYTNKLFQQGCRNALENWVRDNLLIMGWTSFGFCSLQLFGLTMACCFYKALRDLYT